MCSEKGIDRPSMNGAFQWQFFNNIKLYADLCKIEKSGVSLFFCPYFSQTLYESWKKTKLSSFVCPNVQMTKFLCFFPNK